MDKNEFKRLLDQAALKKPALKELTEKLHAGAEKANYHPLVLKTMGKSVNKLLLSNDPQEIEEFSRLMDNTDTLINTTSKTANPIINTLVILMCLGLIGCILWENRDYLLSLFS